jgi:hypothetical protein
MTDGQASMMRSTQAVFAHFLTILIYITLNIIRRELLERFERQAGDFSKVE